MEAEAIYHRRGWEERQPFFGGIDHLGKNDSGRNSTIRQNQLLLEKIVETRKPEVRNPEWICKNRDKLCDHQLLISTRQYNIGDTRYQRFQNHLT